MKKDQILLTNIYNNIYTEKYINEKLDNEFNSLINEENKDEDGVWDVLDKIINPVAKQVFKGASDLSEIPANLHHYFNAKMPEYLDHLGTYLSTILATGVGSALAVNILGKLLMSLAKKMGKTADINTAVLISMLPAEVAQRMKEYENFKQVDSIKYRDLTIDVNFQALEALKKAMKAKNKNIDQGGMLPKVLDYLGKVMNSTPGSMIGGLIIAYLCQKLGMNPLPIFPKIG